MTQQDHVDVLNATLAKMDEAVRWLKRSHAICQDLGTPATYTEQQYDALEALTSRYARLSDILVQKVFRGIDRLELEDSGTVLDVIRRAEKRGLIISTEMMREMRELRNEIAHEYASADLQTLFHDAVRLAPELLVIAERVHEYCRRFQRPGGGV